MKNNILVISLKLESKTKALSKTLWGPACLISIFSLGIVYGLHFLLCSLLDVVSTIMIDNTIILVCLLLLFIVISIIKITKLLDALMSSYKFENNHIIKGKITNTNDVIGESLVLDTIVTAYMSSNIDNSNKVHNANTIRRIYELIKLIELNTNRKFVEEYFDTELYKKKIYNNPKLYKETKYTLIYTCDNNKKLIIPKIYEGMNITQNNQKESPIIGRILIRVWMIFLILLGLSFVDLFIGYKNNPNYISNINNKYSYIENGLKLYGYTSEKHSELCYRFRKEISDKKASTVKYIFDKMGNIDKVEVQLYFDNTMYVDQELDFILKSLDDHFTNNEIDEFISKVKLCISGDCSYGKLTSGKNSLRIDRSDGFIDVHN